MSDTALIALGFDLGATKRTTVRRIRGKWMLCAAKTPVSTINVPLPIQYIGPKSEVAVRAVVSVLRRSSLGMRVRWLRQQAKMSQLTLAMYLGRHRSYIGKIESGAREPTLRGLVLLADALETTTDYLLGRPPAFPSFEAP